MNVNEKYVVAPEAAHGGSLALSPRLGGGLVATVTMPVVWALAPVPTTG
ncbi:MAG: hypothetical protein QM713_03650 [Arachnia sp.]